jgi:uncharacterized protein
MSQRWNDQSDTKRGFSGGSRRKMTVSNSNRDLLRLNVGFIIHQSIGYSRDFDFDIPDLRLSPDLELTDLSGTARITRTMQGLLVQVKMAANVICECVRCLTDFSQPLTIDFTELYAFTPDSVTESGLYVPESGKLDLAPIVREEMLLAIPISPICKPDCKGLCPMCGENRNETDCHHEGEPIDPRLSVLKSLLDKNG